jgi:hypothetical protein
VVRFLDDDSDECRVIFSEHLFTKRDIKKLLLGEDSLDSPPLVLHSSLVLVLNRHQVIHFLHFFGLYLALEHLGHPFVPELLLEATYFSLFVRLGSRSNFVSAADKEG